VLAGNEASDGRSAALPAMVADVLGWPALTHVRELTVTDGAVTGRRETDDGVTVLTAQLPAVVSVSEKINEPRYPSFKGIMAAKKKPVARLTLADVGVDAGEVGSAGASTTVISAAPKPPKSAGEKITDEGDGGERIAAFLVGQKLI
jgi:electron transfer flavoprotein beta subunit